MLGSLLLDKIGGEVDDVDVITVNHYSMTKRALKFLQKLAQPACLNDPVSNISIFHLCARSGYRSLTLGRP
jgi:hypothetical protein